MVLHIISWYKFFVKRIGGLTKTSTLQLETRPTITAIALLTHSAYLFEKPCVCVCVCVCVRVKGVGCRV